MRFFWKALLIVIPLGSYWLYKKSSSPSGDTEVQPREAKENETTSQSPPGRGAAAKQGGVGSKRQESPSRTRKEEEIPTEQIIERLTEIDGVTSRVAENLVEKGIYSREALTALSRDELMEIKGIGPKRAEKILTYDF